MELFSLQKISKASLTPSLTKSSRFIKSPKNAFKYALSRIFIPYNKLIYRYPQLENRKYLLPYYEVKRWLDLLLGGRGKFAYNEFKANNALTRDKVDEIRQMKSDFGI